MLTPFTVAVAEFPALSVTVPVTDWFVPSVPSVLGPETLATPERASEPVKLTVTLVLFQPDPFAGGLNDPVIWGGVLSILHGGVEKLALLPALSVTVTLPE